MIYLEHQLPSTKQQEVKNNTHQLSFVRERLRPHTHKLRHIDIQREKGLTFGLLPPGGTVFIIVYMLSPELVESDNKWRDNQRIKDVRALEDILYV